MYGQGLNSIRWRFTLASAVMATLAFALHGVLAHWLAAPPAVVWGSAALGVALLAGAVLWMATRLTGLLAALQHSTEAVADGNFDHPVEVDCACEVGSLAHSFRRMKHRFNANVLRMNMLAYTDPITALPNRSVVQHLLDWSLAPERQGAFRGALLFIDLDGFKRINDTLGHDGGDELLRLASARLLQQGLQRSADTIDTCMDPFGNPCERLPTDVVFARFAGDEFVAVLPGVTDRAELARVADRVVAALRSPLRVKDQDVTVGASVGIAIAPEDTDSATELLGFADLAMYSAKQAGKGRFHFFDRQVRERMVRHAEIEADLRLALERDELMLHYQPKLRTDSLEIEGVEALVRWHHPQRGLVSPGEFIEVAEKTGLMVPLGRRVLGLAARQCRAWADAGTPRAIAVNVSPSQFADPAFEEQVLATLREADVPPGLISIEITESMAMSEFDGTARRLSRLREAGVRVALDDFGIGFSNLSQLSRVPLDDLKIDRSLVNDIGRNPKSEAIIRAIVAMTHALGFRTVAEGIETDRQLAFLRQVGCTMVQGFLFAKPMPAADLQAWISRREREAAVA